MAYNHEAHMEANHNRRMANEERFITRLAKLQAKTELLIGELVREGRTLYYINLVNRGGAMTGKTKESFSWVELSDYLIRNGYVR